jgi:hypothetical protein
VVVSEVQRHVGHQVRTASFHLALVGAVRGVLKEKARIDAEIDAYIAREFKTARESSTADSSYPRSHA